MHTRRLARALILLFPAPALASAQETRLLRHPTVSRELVAFAYAGDLWVVSRDGGRARRLTATASVESDPRFSPDGSQIAFTATVAGNTDVYVVSTAGGDPKRLTFHPEVDRARGWTPDGRRVVFASGRGTLPTPGLKSYLSLWTIAVEGGMPEALPLPRAFHGAISPDGRRLAYAENALSILPEWDQLSQWRHYRGGRTQPIRVMNLTDHSVAKLPWTDSYDSDPMWVGETVYFLSDRNHTVNLFSYDGGSNAARQLTRHDDFDIMNASAGPDAIVYEQAGFVHQFDVKTGQSRRLTIEVAGDLPWARAHFAKVADMIRDAALSPTGVRAAFEARGEIFTVPAEKGDYRNLTQSPGAHERSPVWSPDGTRLAWFSDASGEYQLMIGDATGTTTPRAVALSPGSFYTAPAWSPDGRSLLFHDNHLNLWMLDLASGQTTKVDTETYHDPDREPDAVWSPDSRWIAYSKSVDNSMRTVFVYSVAEKRAHQLTDGMSDAIDPVFDAGGKYLYFLASTNYGPRTGWADMSAVDRPVRRAIYLVVLAADEPSPLLPETGDEPGPEPGAKSDSAAVRVRIDMDGIRQRILALGLPGGDYHDLSAGAAGTIYYAEPIRVEVASADEGPLPLRLHRYQLAKREAEPFLEGISSYTVSADGKKLLYRAAGGGPSGNPWGVVSTEEPAKVGDGALDLAQLETRVDPRVEWAQMYREAWRIQRDYFYDSAMHGADWQAIYEKYRPFVPHVGHRADLLYLLATVAGELSVGHSYVIPAEESGERPVSVGLLGADFTIENGRYRIRRIYRGENWNPDLQAPLSAPGVVVAEGDYLLEVNGRALTPPTNLYSFFEGTAGRQTLIRVNRTPSLEGSRLVTVVPVASDEALRTRAWIEGNRRRVDELSGGRLAYVYLPNTSILGYTAFVRYYYAQQHKEGAIIDERYNQGGMVPDFIVNELDRRQIGYFAMRDGRTQTMPLAGIYGPKVMVINESAGSGGDLLPYFFRLRKLGPLVGTRTWGGLVGTTGYPPLIDGSEITAPSAAFYDLEGKWAVENEGVPPDIEVEYTPADVVKGRDPQLERAVQEAMKLLQQNPVRRMPRPAPANRVSAPGTRHPATGSRD